MQRSVVTVEPEVTLLAAARRMASEGVGTLVVTDGGKLIGLVTDRDIVIRGLARALPLDARIDSVMSMNVVAIDADSDIRDAQRAFGHHAVRRLPIVDGGNVVGLLSIDDLMVALTEEMSEVTRGITAQIMFPHAADLPPAPVLANQSDA
jgi:CBS domain-containing protein